MAPRSWSSSSTAALSSGRGNSPRSSRTSSPLRAGAGKLVSASRTHLGACHHRAVQACGSEKAEPPHAQASLEAGEYDAPPGTLSSRWLTPQTSPARSNTRPGFHLTAPGRKTSGRGRQRCVLRSPSFTAAGRAAAWQGRAAEARPRSNGQRVLRFRGRAFGAPGPHRCTPPAYAAQPRDKSACVSAVFTTRKRSRGVRRRA